MGIGCPRGLPDPRLVPVREGEPEVVLDDTTSDPERAVPEASDHLADPGRRVVAQSAAGRGERGQEEILQPVAQSGGPDVMAPGNTGGFHSTNAHSALL